MTRSFDGRGPKRRFPLMCGQVLPTSCSPMPTPMFRALYAYGLAASVSQWFAMRAEVKSPRGDFVNF